MYTYKNIQLETKKSFGLAVPLLLSEWLYALNFFMITWITSQLGNESLAAISITQAIYMLLMMMISGISAAIAILVSQDLGSRNHLNVKYSFAQGALLNLLLSVLANLILWNAHYFLPYFGIKDQKVVELAKIALHAYMYCLLPMTFLIMFEKFLIGLHKTKLVLLMTICSIPISIFANYAFVLGKFGFPKCGLIGFGYGLAIAYSVLDLVFIALTFLLPELREFHLFSGFKYLKSQFKYFIEIWRIGWPLGGMLSLDIGSLVVFTFLMAMFGTDALAAYQITRQYLVFAMATLFAVTETTAVRVGFAVGECDRVKLKLSFYVNIAIGLTLMLILSVVYIFANKYLVALDLDITDVKQAHVIYLIKQFFIAIAILILCNGMRNIAAGGLRGLKESRSNMLSSIVGYWIIGLPCAYLLGKILNFGATGLWFGIIIGVAASALLLLFRFRKLSNSLDLRELLIK